MTRSLDTPVFDDIKVLEKVLVKVQETIPKNDLLLDLSEIFKVFGDPTRLKIIFALRQEELCVMHLATVVKMEQSAVSHHLRTLRNNKLVKTRREGKNVFYSLIDSHISDILDIGYQHVTE